MLVTMRTLAFRRSRGEPSFAPAVVTAVGARPTVGRVRLDEAEARVRFGDARVARLATVTGDGRPHIVPIVFAIADDVLYSAVDAKRKTTTALRRLANIAANPQVAVLADHYSDDWTQLWWVRADGAAHLADVAAGEVAIRLLTDRYRQYASQPPPGPVIAIRVDRWTGWQAAAE
jgi:PPOX class probable F420-dependent enzyme